MLTLMEDDWSRREWMRVGSLGAGGLALPSLLAGRRIAAAPRSEQSRRPSTGGAAAAFGKAKSVILFWLTGGPPQQETWDMKPQAPLEVRGHYQPIASAVELSSTLMPAPVSKMNHP